MPTSSRSLTDPAKAAKAARFRSSVRAANACPTCGAPAGYFCKSEETGGRREANHAARVELLVGYSLKSVAWGNQRAKAGKRRRSSIRAGWV